MKTYLESNGFGFVTPKELQVFHRIKRAMDGIVELPSLGVDEEMVEVILSCHIMARAVAKVFGLRVVDGFYYRFFSHSWLTTSTGNVIDVYPVAVAGGPILVHRNEGIDTPGRALYIEKSTRQISRASGGFGKSHFRRAVDIVARELRKANRA